MKNKLCICFIYFLILNFQIAYSQELKRITIKSPAHIGIKEVFQVLKDSPEIKQGLYKKYKYKKLIEEGYFTNNLKDSTWKEYAMTKQLVGEGKYTAGVKSGVWSYYSKGNILVQQYDYDKPELRYFDVKVERSIGNAPSVFPDTSSEIMPIFIGGTFYMQTYLSNNCMYPEGAFTFSKTAKVYINFVVDEDGNILDVKSLKPAGFGFDEEGIRLVSSMSKAFIPGMQKGKKVKVKFVIPINFDLN
jgi:TonB family protein